MRVAASTQTSPLCVEPLSFQYWGTDITPQCKSRNQMQTPSKLWLGQEIQALKLVPAKDLELLIDIIDTRNLRPKESIWVIGGTCESEFIYGNTSIIEVSLRPGLRAMLAMVKAIAPHVQIYQQSCSSHDFLALFWFLQASQ